MSVKGARARLDASKGAVSARSESTGHHRAPTSSLIAAVHSKKAALDQLRPHARLSNLEHAHDLELTYTSNAIEGNTLTAAETTLVIEHGITIGGKPLRDHLEAIDHHGALLYVRGLARSGGMLAERDVRSLHQLVLQRSQAGIAGQYAKQGRFILTDAGRLAFPSPAEIPALMAGFAAWLAQVPSAPQSAFDAHRRLVDIHPFDDGNGRTARLLMNLLLLRGGNPPLAIRPVDRVEYLGALQNRTDAFDTLLYRRLDETLDEYLAAATMVPPTQGPTPEEPTPREPTPREPTPREPTPREPTP